MRSEDIVRVHHMVDAAREALGFVANKTRSDIESDRLLALGLMKSIEIIGEAASKISRECRLTCPAIPWVDVIGMRNRLIHAYADVDPDVLWETVTNDLPSLISALEKIIETEEPM
ncbi:MAG: HepT-like ribonuclease domain-containing protein [Thermodesulfobacteriota bacterium]